MRRLLLIPLLLSLLLAACSSGGSSETKLPSVVIATVTTNQSPTLETNFAPPPSATPAAVGSTGVAIATAVPAAATPTLVSGGKPVETPTSLPAIAATPMPPAASTTVAARDPAAPSTGRWIDVDVTRYVVKLMNGVDTVQTIAPVAVGEQVNTGAYESTQTGLFHVYNKIAGLQWDAPYSTYIADWVGFDAAKANGFHSFLVDKDGSVTDGRTGRISNGCIRTGDARAIFNYSEIGMPVYVHL